MPRQKRTERGYFERTVDLGIDPATGQRIRKRVRAKTLNSLQEKVRQLEQDVERAIEDWDEHGLIFPNEIGQAMEAQNLVNRSFKPALQRAKLPDINFHALRHTTVSLLISSGFDPSTASYIAGHASAAFTVGTYGHAMPESVKAGIAKMGELLKSDRVLELPPRREAVRRSGDT